MGVAPVVSEAESTAQSLSKERRALWTRNVVTKSGWSYFTRESKEPVIPKPAYVMLHIAPAARNESNQITTSRLYIIQSGSWFLYIHKAHLIRFER
jgi:hypothetical protein